MRGGIFSDQKCPLCGGIFVDDGKTGLHCKIHPDQKATRFRVKYAKLYRRVSSYDEALALLGLFRGKAGEGTFDYREYLTARPLGFSNMTQRFLALKKKTMRPNGYRRYVDYDHKACAFFGGRPITQINTGDLEDFIHSLDQLSSYTVKCHLDFVMSVLRWAKRRGDIKEVPEKPSWKWQQRMRRILDKQTQANVIEKVYEKYWQIFPRACVAIELLSVYPKIRPGELLQVKEKDIDLINGTICISQPKESRDPKFVRLVPQHVELIRSLPRGFGEMFFLRHDKGRGGRAQGSRLGKNLLYQLWTAACRELGIEGVPLYPGTKHTTASALARQFPSELVRKATGHASKAFERYLILSEDDCLTLYQAALPGTVLAPDFKANGET